MQIGHGNDSILRERAGHELPKIGLKTPLVISLNNHETPTTGLINGNVQRRASMGPNNKAGPTKLAS